MDSGCFSKESNNPKKQKDATKKMDLRCFSTESNKSKKQGEAN